MITLGLDETILMEVRKHWLGIVMHAIALMIIGLVIPSIILFVELLVFDDIRAVHQLFFGILWLWFVWVMFFVMWTNYYLDVLVITNKRFIDMEQFVLFSRDEVVVPLEQIEDIKIEVKGVLATLLRFGNLQIQTAGATKETMVKSVMHPEKVRTCLQEAVSNMNKSELL